jgi:two-component system, NarL family, sensor kinase
VTALGEPTIKTNELRVWRRSLSAPLAQFVVSGLLVLAILSVLASVLSKQIGRREAVDQTTTSSHLLTTAVLAPVIERGLLSGDSGSIRRLDAVVRAHVLSDKVARVKVWAADGRVIYSDEPRSIGAQFEFGEEEQAAIRTKSIEAELSNLTKPENSYERKFGRLVEVYEGIQLPTGERVLVEQYYFDKEVSAHSFRVLKQLLPLVVGSLLALQLVQLPLVRRLARRIRSGHRDRERLLRQVIEAGEVERRKLARDLHDGVVQNLTGLSLNLAASAAVLESNQSSNGSSGSSGSTGDVARLAHNLGDAGATLRNEIESLRSLIVGLYPPDLGELGGLEESIQSLLDAFNRNGVATSLNRSGSVIPIDVTRLFYRVTREALNNAARHANAKTISVRIDSLPSDSTGAGSAMLDVIDDGTGFDISTLADTQKNGHIGIKAMGDLVSEFGGHLSINTNPGGGTHVRVLLPVRSTSES